MLEQAQAWISDDPDLVTRAELEALVVSEDFDALRERFSGPLQFGTAGLRGLIGAGPSRMNTVTVARATAGLAQQLLEDVPNAAQRGVVVGRDARKMSPELARTTAEILAGHGVTVHWFEQPVPTPVAAFAGRNLNTAATVVVTASHNPPDYNGFKVYCELGHQIIPPQDVRIREKADGTGAISTIRRLDFDDAVAKQLIRPLGQELEDSYLTALDSQCLLDRPPANVSVVTTALHGVGHVWVDKALQRRGFTTRYPVVEQAQPDGRFPTVVFPNPEEKGALDAAKALAREKEVDLVLANDPDTDRLCIAVPSPTQKGAYQTLSGNEVGVLLGDWLLGERFRCGLLSDHSFVVTTVVSTSMLHRVAKSYQTTCYETLTGFKWIWDKARQLEDQGASFVFGFEEALGYCVGPVVRDKDGIGAALVAMELTAALKARGKTLLDRLDELETEHGVHLTSQIATVLPGLEGHAEIKAHMERLRETPPKEIAGSPVVRSRDLLSAEADDLGLPRSNVFTVWLGDDSRLTFRPSGTEPKLKSYLEVRQAVDDMLTLSAARTKARKRLAELEQWVGELIDAGS